MKTLQHECWRYHEMIQRFGFWIGTSERQQQEQDVKMILGVIVVQQMIQHIDIIFNGETITDLIQIVLQVQIQLKYNHHH